MRSPSILYRPVMMRAYYWLIRQLYEAAFESQQMIHYPLFRQDGQSLIEGQQYFSDHVVASVGGIGECDVLEVGCGNGEQAIYLAASHRPRSYRGVDLYAPHIAHAKKEAARRESQVVASIDDAQRLVTVADGDVDVVLCVESAHHYADKRAFLRQVRRVLRPGGRVVVAEIISCRGRVDLLGPPTSTYYCSEEAWRRDIGAAGLVLDRVEDVTDGLRHGLDDAAASLSAGYGIKGLFARTIGRRMLRHYARKLSNDRRYLLFIAHR